MRHNINRIIILLFITFGTGLNAQEQRAIIEYRGEMKQTYADSFVNAFNERKDMPMARKQRLAESFLNAEPEDFFLHIDGDESYYHLEKSLELDGGYNMGSNAPIYDYYTNKENGLIIEFSTIFGKISHKPLSWEVTGDSKEIAGYTCFKATTVERLYSRQGFYYNRAVVAWFAPALPPYFGPSQYSNLPGLVLEIERDMFTLKAVKIILNPPKKDINITRVSKDDKMITEEKSHSFIGGIEEERRSGN